MGKGGVGEEGDQYIDKKKMKEEITKMLVLKT